MPERYKTLIVCAASMAVCLIVCAIIVLTGPTPFASVIEGENEEVPTQIAPKVQLNINTASVEEFVECSVFDRDTALSIIAYRETYGDFTQVSDLLKVEEVTAEMYNNVFGYLTCS